jgi:hypothetical protein
MATLAAIRAAATSSSVFRPSSAASASPYCDSRNGPQIFAVAATRSSFTSSSIAATTAALSSSSSYVPFGSSSKLIQEVERSARRSVRASGASTSPRCEGEGNTEQEKEKV